MKKTLKNLALCSIALLLSNSAFADNDRTGLDKILDNINSQQNTNISEQDKVVEAKKESNIILGKGESVGEAKISPITPSIAAELKVIAQNATGFMTGKITQDQKPIMVLFDPQCPYCKSLWNASRAGENQNIPVIWIPVSILNDDSYGQSAALLSSEHPIDIMNRHIAIMDSNGKGIDPIKKSEIPDQLKLALDRNILLYSKMGFHDFPIIIKITKKGNLLVKKGDTSVQGLKIIGDM